MMKSKRIIPILFILILSLFPMPPFVESAGYGEENENLGQFTDDFENDDNVSVAVNVINNQTLDCMEYNMSSSSGWLAGYEFRKSHNITGSTVRDLTNYQVGIVVYYASGVDGTETIDGDVMGKVYLNGSCETDFGDVRFTSSDGMTVLDCWPQIKVDSNFVVIWVEIDSILISANLTTIYIYYGKSGETTSSNGDNTFPFFDNFNNLDTNKWDVEKKGSVNAVVQVVGGELQLSGEAGVSSSGNVATKTFNVTDSFKTKARRKATANYYRNFAFGYGDITGEGGVNWWATVFDDDGYATFFGGAASIAQIDRWDNGARTTIVVAGAVSQGNNAYYIESISYDQNGNLYLYTTGGTRGPIQDVTYQGNDKRILLSQGEHGPTGRGGTSYFDWFFVRKYVNPEPTHGAWGNEENSSQVIGTGYFITENYLAYTTGNSLTSLTNSSIPEGLTMTVQFSNDNATWLDNEGNVGSTPIEQGFYAIDLRDLNYTVLFQMYNFSGTSSLTPRLYQSRLVTTNGTAGAGPVGPGPTVIQNVTGEWFYYNLTTITVTVGTHDIGDLNSTLDIDGDTYDCSEVVGAPGYVIEFVWTDVDQEAHCLWVTAYIFYDGVSAHTINVDLWNFTAPGWVTIGTIYDMVGFEWVNSSIYDLRMPNDFINSTGAVRGRFYHSSAGNINDDIHTDFLKLYAFIPFEDEAVTVVTVESFFWIPIAIVLSIIAGLLVWLQYEHK